MHHLTGILGLIAIVGSAFLFSTRRSAIKLSILLWGLGLQFGFAFLVLRTGFGRVFQLISEGVNALLHFAVAGSSFVFGEQLGSPSGPFGVVFAFQRPVWRRLCLPGAGGHHLHRVVFLGHVLRRHHALARARDGGRNAQDHA